MRILFFAQLKDVTKCDHIELHPGSPLTAELLWVELIKQFPALAAQRAGVRLAKNLEFTDGESKFADGDKVALIPPVSGG